MHPLHSLLTLICLLSISKLHSTDYPLSITEKPEFSIDEKSLFPHEIDNDITDVSPNDPDCRIKITGMRGTSSKLRVGEAYIITGTIYCDHPGLTALYFGVTSASNKGASDINGYTRHYHPKKKKSYFKLGFKATDSGQIHLSAYKRDVSGKTDWNNGLRRLEIGDPIK